MIMKLLGLICFSVIAIAIALATSATQGYTSPAEVISRVTVTPDNNPDILHKQVTTFSDGMTVTEVVEGVYSRYVCHDYVIHSMLNNPNRHQMYKTPEQLGFIPVAPQTANITLQVPITFGQTGISTYATVATTPTLALVGITAGSYWHLDICPYSPYGYTGIKMHPGGLSLAQVENGLVVTAYVYGLRNIYPAYPICVEVCPNDIIRQHTKETAVVSIYLDAYGNIQYTGL